ncbi:3'-5' exonuclease [Rhizobium laguerreae]|uniref:3'-5' exonuclease n=1 Tax=Rhizobium laguerreae TaxID=1076926 RepID=UPI001E47DEF0|nr:3'-5' exonuclease [Rhizobium laguerreae]UFW65803.1 3'-5' exonuclease [Rhizobium laguerreae]
MDYSADIILDTLLRAKPRSTAHAPRDSRGLYGLVDHHGVLRYIGSTCSANETLYRRIHQRHRTGSESTSHYFSRMYNTGRMWRDRDDKLTVADGLIAKELRNAFIADHCAAVWITLPDDLDISGLERAVLSIAPAEVIAWNGRRMQIYEEPVELVDATIRRLGWGSTELEAIERQRHRHISEGAISPAVSLENRPPSAKPVPVGEFRFVAIDVETANSDRASICQIGLACVRPDNSIETWMTYVDPRTNDWSCSRIHGITARTVKGARSFHEVFPQLEQALSGKVVYQHSAFDQSAIAAACARGGLILPTWNWRDSVQVARAAWPELKGSGGHGLASLKNYLGLGFTHHDAEEDAKASAEVVLRAERQAVEPRAADLPVRPYTPINAATEIRDTTAVQIAANDGADAPNKISFERSFSPMAAKPIPRNPIRDALLARIAVLRGVHPHPSQRDINGTKYISAFILGGTVFAIDKMSAGKQPIWILDRADIRTYLDAERVSYEVYNPERSRNHNLFKLPNFKNGQLLRMYPASADQGIAIIAQLAK